MTTVANEHLPACRSIKSLHYPDFWESPSFAHNLFWAFEGFTCQRKFRKAGATLKQTVTEKNGGVQPYPGGDYFSKSSGLPKMIYSVIKEDLFPEVQYEQLSLLCADRCSNLFAPYDIYADNGANFHDAFEVLDKAGGPVGLKVVKTWLNGWATSHRMHEDPMLDCILGCKMLLIA
jgi:hypothetical protein